MPRARPSRFVLSVLAAVVASAPLAAQTTTPAPATTQPAATQPAATPSAFIFSGLLFGNYNYQLPTTTAQLPNQANNGFILDRAYLTFRAPAGDRLSVRVTTDVYQTTETTQNAYTIRAKYAYLQYDQPRSATGAGVYARLGIIQNVVIDQFENFWPRYLSQVAIERAGYFASADVGLGAGYVLPNKYGELYATLMNGPGYTARERDRFKDFAVRLTLTPFGGWSPSLWQTFSIIGWTYQGATASGFVNSGPGQIGAVGAALDRDRSGIFVGIRDPRLVLGGEFDVRKDGGDAGLNTVASPRTGTETSGRLWSGLAVVRPFAFTNASGRSPFGLVGRYDHVSPTTSTEGIAPPPPSDNSYHTLIGGLFYDLNARAQFALDYQESLPTDNGVSLPPPAPLKAYFVHFVVNF